MNVITEWVLRLGALSVAATATIAFVGWLLNKLVVQPLADSVRDEVVERTKPIQPEANGGKSLPDAINLLRNIHDRQTDIGDRLARMEGKFESHLDQHERGTA